MLRTGAGVGGEEMVSLHPTLGVICDKLIQVEGVKALMGTLWFWTKVRDMTSGTASIGRCVCNPCFCLFIFL